MRFAAFCVRFGCLRRVCALWLCGVLCGGVVVRVLRCLLCGFGGLRVCRAGVFAGVGSMGVVLVCAGRVCWFGWVFVWVFVFGCVRWGCVAWLDCCWAAGVLLLLVGMWCVRCGC